MTIKSNRVVELQIQNTKSKRTSIKTKGQICSHKKEEEGRNPLKAITLR